MHSTSCFFFSLSFPLSCCLFSSRLPCFPVIYSPLLSFLCSFSFISALLLCPPFVLFFFPCSFFCFFLSFLLLGFLFLYVYPLCMRSSQLIDSSKLFNAPSYSFPYLSVLYLCFCYPLASFPLISLPFLNSLILFHFPFLSFSFRFFSSIFVIPLHPFLSFPHHFQTL